MHTDNYLTRIAAAYIGVPTTNTKLSLEEQKTILILEEARLIRVDAAGFVRWFGQLAAYEPCGN